MISGDNLGTIINFKKKNCYLSFVNFAEFPNFGVINEENMVKYKKCDSKKIHYNFTIIDKKFEPDLLCGFKVLKGFNNMFELYKLIFNYNILVMIFIFLFIQMAKLIKVFQFKFVWKDMDNSGLWKTRIFASN